MPLTKAEISDLESLIDAKTMRIFDSTKTEHALSQANHNLKQFLWRIGPDNPDNQQKPKRTRKARTNAPSK